MWRSADGQERIEIEQIQTAESARLASYAEVGRWIEAQQAEALAAVQPVGAPHILVVEDDKDMRSMIKDVLEPEGYAIDTAADGAAVHVSADNPPALVLLDLMMPIIDGYEVGRRLRADPRTAAIPIIVMSSGTHAAQGAQQIGANGYLAKPFDLNELLRTVAAYAP
jgi:CheY-like chemotaxis protein